MCMRADKALSVGSEWMLQDGLGVAVSRRCQGRYNSQDPCQTGAQVSRSRFREPKSANVSGQFGNAVCSSDLVGDMERETGNGQSG